MAELIKTLTDKEKETLRLLVRGHDAKSMSRALDLSIHTINDRLRAARRKLQVTSSKEAARLLLAHESNTPENLADKELGNDHNKRPVRLDDGPVQGWSRGNLPIIAFTGVLLMFAIIAALALSTHPALNDSDLHTGPDSVASVADREAIAAASDWLALVDEADWEASFATAGKPFRDVNTVATWADASRQVRGPLGALVSRKAVSVRYLNAPPRGFKEVVFQSQFVKKADVLETVTLQKEDGIWKPVGVLSE